MVATMTIQRPSGGQRRRRCRLHLFPSPLFLYLSFPLPRPRAVFYAGTVPVQPRYGSIVPANESKGNGIKGFFEAIKSMWNSVWVGLVDFFTGKTCRSKCSNFFDFNCHIKYICVSWILMFGLLLAIFPTVVMLLWLLHQKGFFDPLYDWWDDRFGDGNQRIRSYSMHRKHTRQSRIRDHEDNGHRVHHKDRLHPSHVQKKRNSSHAHHLLHKHPEWAASDHYHLIHDSNLHVHKERHKHKHNKDILNSRQSYYLSRNGPLSRETGVMRDEGAKYDEVKLARQKHVHGRVHGEHLHSKQYGKDSWNLM